jgi:hypothetical protein
LTPLSDIRPGAVPAAEARRRRTSAGEQNKEHEGTPGKAGADSDKQNLNGGYGLIGVRERLLLINGTLTTGSDQRCWTVTAQVPQ